jgi:glycosyltransferase involved in cell wall biosynthesis
MQSTSQTIWALICGHNESNRIGNLVSSVVKYVPALVVDDGSDDDTAIQALSAGSATLILPTSQGKGNALSKGLELLCRFDLRYVICLDGDGQHDPRYIPELINSAMSGKDIVLGNRLHQKHNMPLPRIISNSLTSFVISLFTKKLVRDSQCGYRILSRKALSLQPQEKGFMFESEQLFLAARNNMHISHTDISTIYYSGAIMRFHVLKDIVCFLSVLLREIRARIE